MRRVLQWATNVAVAISTLPRDAVASEPAVSSLALDSVPTSEPHPEWSTAERLRRMGPHDPVFDAAMFLWPCPCGGTAVVASPSAADDCPVHDAHLYLVRCPGCGRCSASWPSAWQAVTEWDQAHPHDGLALEQFPFFELSGLSQRQARTRLLSVRAELEARRLAINRRLQAGKEVSRRYRERVDAYLRWTMVAHALAHRTRQGTAGRGQR